MKKVVHDYITRKINQAVQPKLDELGQEICKQAVPSRNEILEAIGNLPEYKKFVKAAEAMLTGRGLGWTRDSLVDCIYLCGSVCNKKRAELVKARDELCAKTAEVIEDTLAELELAGSKADVDEAIARAVAAISKAK